MAALGCRSLGDVALAIDQGQNITPSELDLAKKFGKLVLDKLNEESVSVWRFSSNLFIIKWPVNAGARDSAKVRINSLKVETRHRTKIGAIFTSLDAHLEAQANQFMIFVTRALPDQETVFNATAEAQKLRKKGSVIIVRLPSSETRENETTYSNAVDWAGKAANVVSLEDAEVSARKVMAIMCGDTATSDDASNVGGYGPAARTKDANPSDEGLGDGIYAIVLIPLAILVCCFIIVSYFVWKKQTENATDEDRAVETPKGMTGPIKAKPGQNPSLGPMCEQKGQKHIHQFPSSATRSPPVRTALE